ncbi:glycosyltransferase family 2 protein [Hanstruepera marina]|uniref:glycosyltransferase family 2 protein n=1 Tax=Hanstruepera marina TaxID=2873265 RepID=UPI001CA62B4B|nr:glycosyltransferase [Hanstruepera marina]
MENEQPLVSIILPVYNGEKTIKATLDSLLNQTYEHFELHIGIDGTNDASKTIIESFDDKRIVIHENPTNLGLAKNVNKLISLTPLNSDLIAMAEQDDFYVPERLEWQVAIMRKYPNVGLVSGITEFVGDNKSVFFPGILVKGKAFPQGEELFKYLYINQLKVVNTCMMFRKSVHMDNNLSFKDTYGNFNVDWNYVLRFALVSNIFGIPKVLVKMNRKSNRQSVTTNKRKQYQASRQLLKDFKKEFPVLIPNKDYKAALKAHRKIEFGINGRLMVILKGIYYSLIYLDMYFVKYIFLRIKTLIAQHS